MKIVTAWQVKDFTATTVVVFGIYLVSYFLVWVIITPAQEALIPEITKYASLLFLPHGIRVLATSLVGGKSVLGMVLAEFVGNYFFWGIDAIVPLCVVSIASGTVTWIVFEGLKALRVNAFYTNVTSEPPPFHTLLLAGILASATNAFLVTAIMEGHMTIGNVMSVLAAYMTGDVTGLLAVMMAARYVMPLVNRIAE